MITKNELINKYGELYILEHYLGTINFKKNFINPIRNNDKTPSGRFYNNNGKVTFVDFADDNYSFDVFKYVMEVYSLNFKEALEKISVDLEYVRDNSLLSKLETKRKLSSLSLMLGSIEDTNKPNMEFIVKKRLFNEYDLEFWSKFNIDESILRRFNVSALSSYQIQTDTKKFTAYTYNKLDPCFAFEFKNKGYTYYKIYRPLTKLSKNKWRSNVNKDIIQGYNELPYESSLLFITSSLKDCMTLFSLGYEAIAPQSENTSIDAKVLDRLHFIYNHVVYFYDYDMAGVKSVLKNINVDVKSYDNKSIDDLISLTNNAIFTYDECKDISDYIVKYGIKRTVSLIKNQLKSIKITRIKRYPWN